VVFRQVPAVVEPVVWVVMPLRFVNPETAVPEFN